MQPLMSTPVLQGVALALFSLGLILGAALPSYRAASDAAVHAGVLLLAAACAIADGEVCSRAVRLLLIALQFFVMQLTHRVVPQWADGPTPTLLAAVEVTLAMTGASRDGVIAGGMAYTASLLASLLLFSAGAASVFSRPLHSFLSREDSVPMVVLSLVVTSGIMLRSPHYVVLLPVAHGFYVSQTDIAWICMFAALSASQSLYSRGARDEVRKMVPVALATPTLFACCLTYLGDLSAGVSLALAACVVMRRCGHAKREVCLAALCGVTLPLLLSTVVPNMSGCWGAWLSAGSKLSLADVSTRGWMGHVLNCFGVPGAVCLVVMSACAACVGVRSMVSDGGTGVMAPFLCVTWSIELMFDLLGTVWAIPPFFSCMVPFSGVTDTIALPLLSGAAVAIAMVCDLRVVEMVADDPEIAWRFEVAGSADGLRKRHLLPESAGGDRS